MNGFVHVERMGEERVVKRVYRAIGESNRRRRKTAERWRDGVEK